jgi:hypothetical protein
MTATLRKPDVGHSSTAISLLTAVDRYCNAGISLLSGGIRMSTELM